MCHRIFKHTRNQQISIWKISRHANMPQCERLKTHIHSMPASLSLFTSNCTLSNNIFHSGAYKWRHPNDCSHSASSTTLHSTHAFTNNESLPSNDNDIPVLQTIFCSVIVVARCVVMAKVVMAKVVIWCISKQQQRSACTLSPTIGTTQNNQNDIFLCQNSRHSYGYDSYVSVHPYDLAACRWVSLNSSAI